MLPESRVQPLLLVFENLPWNDAETQTVLDSLIDSLPTARMLLLVNYRPEYQHRWGNKTYYTQLRLDPLPPRSAQDLLAALLGNDAGLVPLKQRLIAQIEGNPFFLEESVRTLLGAFAEGMTYGEEALQIAEAVGQPFTRIETYVPCWLFLPLQRGPPQGHLCA
jgi:predicted ATPase